MKNIRFLKKTCAEIATSLNRRNRKSQDARVQHFDFQFKFKFTLLFQPNETLQISVSILIFIQKKKKKIIIPDHNQLTMSIAIWPRFL